MEYKFDELVKIIGSSGLFDEKFYLRRYREVRIFEDSPLEHYCKIGILEDFKPNAYFDPHWYREHYEDVSQSGIYPFVHYILFGKKEGRIPSKPDKKFRVSKEEKSFVAAPDSTETQSVKQNEISFKNLIHSFDIEAYLEANPDLKKLYDNANRDSFIKEHLYAVGLDEIKDGKRKFHHEFEVFDDELYKSEFPKVKDAVDNGDFSTAFQHFVLHGYFEIISGDREWPGKRESLLEKLLSDFEEKPFYETNPDIKDAIDKGAFRSLKHYMRFIGLKDMERGARRFHSDFEAFDEKSYLGRFDDVAEVLESGLNFSAFDHFCDTGYRDIIEGRRYWPRKKIFFSIDERSHSNKNSIDYEELFDRDYYLSIYRDVRESKLDPLAHYINSGWKEGRDPHPLFQTNVYLDTEKGLKEKLIELKSNPLEHYLYFGDYEKRKIFYDELLHTFKSYSCSTETVIFKNKIKSKTKMKAAAFIHVYYPDIGVYLIDECLDNGLDIYISFIEGTDYQPLIKKYGDKIKYKVFENRGRDIAPFVLGFREEIEQYEFALHLHTKKSLHYGKERRDWLEYSLESLLGNIETVEEIFAEDEQVSIVFPEPPDFIKDLMNWGYNFNKVYKLMQMLGRKIDKFCKFDFPAGSMFWFRVRDLMPIFNLNLSLYHFEREDSQVDGTLAHAIERLFGIYILDIGKKLLPLRYEKSEIFSFEEKRLQKSDLIVTKNAKSEIEYSFTYSKFYPELHPITFCASENIRYRLNILVPTINQEHIFGGIATAMEFFFTLAKKLDWEMRILTTDSKTDLFTMKNYRDFSNYTLDYLCEEDGASVVSLVPRELGDLPVRKNDIFIATAWWSAWHLKYIERFQYKRYASKKSHIYFIQDYEPHFYGWSSKYQLAYSTYFNEWISIYNTELLYDYFKGKSLISGDSYILKPVLNRKISKSLKRFSGIRKEKIVLVYGRPFAIRNCNEIILEAISIFRRYTDTEKEWKIISLGEKYDHPLLEELDIEVLGKVTLEEYAELLAKSFIGVSLMISPHPSYPPYEMLASDLYTFTSVYENKNRDSFSLDKLTVDYPNAPTIADFLKDKTSIYCDDIRYDSEKIDEISFGEGLEMEELTDIVSKKPTWSDR